MREIKFRGKEVDDNKWIYGWFSEDYGFAEILTEYDDCEVLLETVGQYTGLKDKNGIEIYEGDVLHKDSYWGWHVEFEDGAFCRVPNNYVQRVNWVHHRMKQNDVEDWEVIGNIHDNPELIGEKE